MKTYPENSPESMAQLLTALMAADERIDDAEVEALSILDAYARIGIRPPAFADVLRDYFAGTDAGCALDRVDRISARITDARARAVLWEVMAGLAGADDEVVDAERAFLARVASVWWDGVLPARLAMPGSPELPSLPESLLQARGDGRQQLRSAPAN